MVTKPRILVVEDEPGIADTLRYVLATEGFTPVWCATAAEALREFRAAPPALAVLDVGLPDLNGFELFRQLQALPGGPGVPMLFLTARSDEIDRVVGLELGADDYIAKPFSPRELTARVRTILRRSGRAAAAVAVTSCDAEPGRASEATRMTGDGREAGQSGRAAASNHAAPLRLDEERRRIFFYGQALDLSRYEYGLLCTLMRRPGRVYTRDELLRLVWDADADSFDRTVDAHVKTLRAKLRAVAPGVDAVRTLRGTGYALAEDLPPRPPAQAS